MKRRESFGIMAGFAGWLAMGAGLGTTSRVVSLLTSRPET
jgi:hypothetical protein